MKKKHLLSACLGACLTVLLLGVPAVVFSQSTTTVTYVPTDETIMNPERGLFQGSEVVTGTTQLTLSVLRRYQADGSTLINRYYYFLGDTNRLLPSSYLTFIQNDMNVIRQAGMKTIVKFAYTRSAANPVDAHINIMLQHLDQLAPVLQRNRDVIAGMEAGFIGAWGEWGYSSHGYTDSAEVQRRLVNKILSVLPPERMVCIRTVMYKYDLFGTGLFPVAEAYAQTPRSRVGIHNDAFLAGWDDLGTYYLTGVLRDTAQTKPWLQQESKYLLIGGETVTRSQRTTCTIAMSELRRFHFSFLNRYYSPGVIDTFERYGCWDDIDRMLGYRFVLLGGEFSSTSHAGGDVHVSLRLTNIGCASPFNRRNVELLLRSRTDGSILRYPLNDDPRFWFAGDTVTVDTTLKLPPTLTSGDYDYLLHLADPETTLHDRPEYAIRVANQNVWESATGFNNLLASVNVSGTVVDRISGTVFFDRNNNGAREAGEPGMPGWSIVLTGPVSLNAMTDSAGAYTFEDLPHGSYTVRQPQKTSWGRTYPRSSPGYLVAIAGDTSFVCDFGNYSSAAHPLGIHSGWNTLSLPFLVPDLSATAVFPTLQSDAFAFDGQYTRVDSLRHGIGYWMKFAEDHTLWVAGEGVAADTFELREGWNLVGSIGVPIAVTNVRTIPDGIIAPTFWAYDQGYVHADTIFPGGGYMIQATAPGLLILPADAPVLAIPSAGFESPGLQRITFTPSSGRSQSLILADTKSGPVDPAAAKLPPLPPAGAFDVRFLDEQGYGSIARTFNGSDSREARIMLSGGAFPVKVTWNLHTGGEFQYSLSYNGETHALTSSGGELTIDRGAAVDGGQPVYLTLKAGSVSDQTQIRAFSLAQNYPNPFNNTTMISFTSPSDGDVDLAVYNVLGERVGSVARGRVEGGTHTYQFDASSLAAGVYFYRITLRTAWGMQTSQTKVMMLIK